MDIIDTLVDRTAKSFNLIHLDNPLRGLDKGDRIYLVTLLEVYRSVEAGKRVQANETERMESLHKIALQFGKLSKRLNAVLVKEGDSGLLSLLAEGFEDLPMRLKSFSIIYKVSLEGLGSPGHKRDLEVSLSLVEASEFAKIKTGKHNDDHLACLYGKLCDDPSGNGLSPGKIRKKRNYLKKHYPRIYDFALRRAKQVDLIGTHAAPLVPDIAKFLVMLLSTYSVNGTEVK